MFIGRRVDRSIYGCWTSKQPDDADHPGQEEIADNHPDLLAYLTPKTRDPRLIADDIERDVAKQDAAILVLVNSTPAQCIAFARNNFPSLTLAEQNRLGMLINILAVAVRPVVR
jgi:hypothetical protein